MNLVVNLIEWSVSQTLRMEFNPEFFDLVELINEVVELSNDSARP
jgi:two-component system, sensor histidine kinase and response regulator